MPSIMAILGTALVWLLFLAVGAGIGFGAFLLWERFGQRKGSSESQGAPEVNAPRAGRPTQPARAPATAAPDPVAAPGTAVRAPRSVGFLAGLNAKINSLLKGKTLEEEVAAAKAAAWDDDEDGAEGSDEGEAPDRAEPTAHTTAPAPGPTPLSTLQPTASRAPTPTGPPAHRPPTSPTRSPTGTSVFAPPMARPARASPNNNGTTKPTSRDVLMPSWARAAAAAAPTMRAQGWASTQRDAQPSNTQPPADPESLGHEAQAAFQAWRAGQPAIDGSGRTVHRITDEGDAEAFEIEASQTLAADDWSQALKQAARHDGAEPERESESAATRRVVAVDSDDMPEPPHDGVRRTHPVVPDYQDPEETPIDEHGRRVIRISNQDDEDGPSPAWAPPGNAGAERTQPRPEDAAWPARTDREAEAFLKGERLPGTTGTHDLHPNAIPPEDAYADNPPGSGADDLATLPSYKRDQDGVGPNADHPAPEPENHAEKADTEAHAPGTPDEDREAHEAANEAPPKPSAPTAPAAPSAATPGVAADTTHGLPQVPIGRRQQPEGSTLSRAEAIEELNAIYGLTYDEGVGLVEAGLWGFENHDEWVRGVRAGSGTPPWLPLPVVEKVLARPLRDLKPAIDTLREKRKALGGLEKLWGVGPAEAAILYDNGYTSREDLDAASTQKLSGIKGIGAALAFQIKASLHGLAPDDAKGGKETAEKTA